MDSCGDPHEEYSVSSLTGTCDGDTVCGVRVSLRSSWRSCHPDEEASPFIPCDFPIPLQIQLVGFAGAFWSLVGLASGKRLA